MFIAVIGQDAREEYRQDRLSLPAKAGNRRYREYRKSYSGNKFAIDNDYPPQAYKRPEFGISALGMYGLVWGNYGGPGHAFSPGA